MGVTMNEPLPYKLARWIGIAAVWFIVITALIGISAIVGTVVRGCL